MPRDGCFRTSDKLCSQTAGANVWLKQWSEASDKPGADVDVKKYLGIYLAFALGSAGLACRKLHESMIIAIFRSPVTFFKTTPAGRILNRFSSDIYLISQLLPRQFNTLFINSAKALFCLAVISSGAPAFILLVIPLVLLYDYMQQYYMGAKRELKRLDGVSRSPVFAHFQESLRGLTTIRTYLQQDRFIHDNEHYLDANMKAYIPSITGNRWLGVQLEFIGSIIILATAVLTLTDLSPGSHLSAGLLAIGEIEINIVSADRVLEFTQLPSETPDVIPNHRPAVGWPARGSVQFVDYSTRYRPELPLILQNLNLDFEPYEKIGVVGRTGAGKSSLALALFRIIKPSGGRIHVDDINTLTIELARLKEHVVSMTGGLDAQVYEWGSILCVIKPESVTEQLMSLARAMLKQANIFDTRIQQTLRENIFSNQTIIAIAHPINTIIDFDCIVALENGKVVEFDALAALMRQKGAFTNL
ncbi:ABC transporter type 1, transmembrane domain-containing protein [Dactylonectria estremocensis]|uniref:ABC transporter type 1, transmembrane domain-containing protein n=1 Tax=Dactylonectria estremocensis TaxID=1079267 RepID=A0A9P9J585_9HYPO|nr:ABC transporter type 1, transmembrane domain-containing protein [Dactylonectria estremocensis]